MPAPSPRDRIRSSSWSGQRSFPLVVEPRPSVSESPRMTAAAAAENPSRAPRRYQWSTGTAPGSRGSATCSPKVRYDVVRDPGCPVTPPAACCPAARYIVTVTLTAAATGKSTGSETASSPAGTTTPGRPAKVTARDVPASTELTPARPPPGIATPTRATSSFEPPNALLIRSRTRRAPAETRIVCRSVLSGSTRSSLVNGAGGRLAGSTRCGAAVQMPTQRPVNQPSSNVSHPRRGRGGSRSARPCCAAALLGGASV